MRLVNYLIQIAQLPIIYLGDIYNTRHMYLFVESKIATYDVDQPVSIQISFGDNQLTSFGNSSRVVKAAGMEIDQEDHT